MTEDPAAVTPGASIAEAARIMEDLDAGVVPVVDSHDRKRLLGVITARGIAIRAVARRKGADTPVSECLSPGVHTVNQNDSIRRLMGVMRAHRVRRVPVVAREGGRTAAGRAVPAARVRAGGGRPLQQMSSRKYCPGAAASTDCGRKPMCSLTCREAFRAAYVNHDRPRRRGQP